MYSIRLIPSFSTPSEWQKGGITLTIALIVLAIGQTHDLENLGLSMDDFKSNDYRINNTNIFFAGDLAPLDKSVVYAVKTAKEVTKKVLEFVKEGK